MTVAVIYHSEALNRLAQSLRLPETSASIDAESDALIAQAIRRAIFILAPCAYPTLRTSVAAALSPFFSDPNQSEDRVATVIENLLAVGDILEMRREGFEAAGLVLRPAPPSFVMRKDRTIILLGVAGDELTPVPNQMVAYRSGGLRTLAPSDPAACRSALSDAGLIEMPLGLWLHAPALVTANTFLESWHAKLPVARSPEKIEGLEILDTRTPTKYYKGRWRPLTDADTGIYVGRRPRRYGANLWCLVEVKGGLVQRFVDVHSKDARMRDCDEAWRLQAAFDAVASAPQKVGVLPRNGKVVMSFGSPLPAWAVRRLALIGESTVVQGALLAFEMPQENIEEELRWLEDMLWLSRTIGGNA